MSFLNDKDRIGAALLLVFAVVYLRFAFEIPSSDLLESDAFSARTLPYGLAVCTIITSLVILLRRSPRSGDEDFSAGLKRLHWYPAGGLVLAMLAYAEFFSVLGFHLATFLFLAASFLILGERRVAVVLSLSLGLVLFTWLFTAGLFGLYIDNGDLIRYLFPAQPAGVGNA